jgi:hypothetical protein
MTRLPSLSVAYQPSGDFVFPKISAFLFVALFSDAD